MSKYYPSSAAFARGRSVHTEYNSGCRRKIFLSDQGLREILPASTKAVGATNEDEFADRLGSTYQREVKVQSDSDLGLFSGRADYLSADEVIELKSTRSDNKRRRLRNEGPILENIAQLIAYMVELEISYGRLIYTYFGTDKKTGAPVKEDFEFATTIDQYGDIYVRGTRFPFNVHDYLSHRVLIGQPVTTVDDLPRPANYNKPFGSPCSYCPFKSSCEKLDKGHVSTILEYVEDARKSLASLPIRE